MGNLASGHFKPTNNIQEQHNDRTLSPSYLIPQEFRGQNEVNRHSKQAMILKNQIIENAHETYLITFKQKSQAKSYQWSLVVNTKETTTMSDLEKLAEHFEIKYGFQCYQIAIHRDEGYIDENNQPHINHHAHMEFITLNKENGKNMWGQINKVKLRQIQTEIAQILGMERGTDKRVSGTKRIEPRKYAQMKEKERKKLEAKEKEINTLESKLQEQNKTINELQERPTTEQYSQLEQANSEQTQTIQEKDKEIATLNTLNAKLEKANQDLQRPSMWDTIKESITTITDKATGNTKWEIEGLKRELISKEQSVDFYIKEWQKQQRERYALEKKIATALDTANEYFQSKEENLQEAVERNKIITEQYFLLDSLYNDPNSTNEYTNKLVEKHKHRAVFTKLWNAIKELFSLRKWFANIKKILFGDENTEKDPQEIEQTIKELSERPTKSDFEYQRKCRKEAVKHYQEAEKIVFGKVNMGSLLFEIVADDAAKKLNERLTELVGKESKLNTLESADLALDLEKAQDRIKTLESNQTALKNDLNAKESAIQAKEKELNTLKQERTDLKDKLQAQEKTINELNKKLQELEDNYRLERERMVAENKRLKEQGLEKIYTQKDYEDLKKRHEKEIEALKKEIQEQDKTIKKNKTYRRIAENARSRKAQQKRKTTTPTPSPTPQETYTYSKRM
ncbi:hypothetical protein [Helicobacter pylori]|uniref:hypothetical protein n=1 Tax=Helicobacter pylori TaxID=210 RepID=UPI0002BA750F|nr:hypothetical protein [Helicobacter pylori]EMH05531.1 hypothetical protein HMPREF1406_00017 [Helicobacter pylori GAM239Bi]